MLILFYLYIKPHLWTLENEECPTLYVHSTCW
jgi:hypothetical protein